MRKDRQTDMTELTDPFRNSAKAPKNCRPCQVFQAMS